MIKPDDMETLTHDTVVDFMEGFWAYFDGFMKQRMKHLEGKHPGIRESNVEMSIYLSLGITLLSNMLVRCLSLVPEARRVAFVKQHVASSITHGVNVALSRVGLAEGFDVDVAEHHKPQSKPVTASFFGGLD
jgi:hypothetical protein